jgi:carbon monoxide dehydrogenase subunit G
MKIEGAHIVSSRRQDLWQLMTDPEILRRTVPGCQALEAADDGSYKITLKAGVGSIKGVFTGTIRLEDLRQPEHYRLVVDAKGSVGFLKGTGDLDLVDEGAQTTIKYSGEVSIGGTIASVGQRMVQSSSRMMASQFFTAVEAEAAAAARARQTEQPVVPPKQSFFEMPCDRSQGD